jgi:hypothetical protein
LCRSLKNRYTDGTEERLRKNINVWLDMSCTAIHKGSTGTDPNPTRPQCGYSMKSQLFFFSLVALFVHTRQATLGPGAFSSTRSSLMFSEHPRILQAPLILYILPECVSSLRSSVRHITSFNRAQILYENPQRKWYDL